MNPANTITPIMAPMGRMDSTLSTVARFLGVVISVIQALKAESLAVEPIKVITQSITITATLVAVTTAATLEGSSPKSFATLSLVIKPKISTVKPHSR